MPKVYARLFAIIARDARKAVVFRRGPSKNALLLSWDLQTDALVTGQWFQGRIYERRCDLSPSGDLLVYFAANFRAPPYSWTAISRPPYLAALALWQNGTTWGGGGLFVDGRTLQLNHLPVVTSAVKPKFIHDVAPSFELPPGLIVEQLRETSGRGEDDPIQSTRFERDGWRMMIEGHERKDNPRYFRYFDPPYVFEKFSSASNGMNLRVTRHGLYQRNGRWYDETAQVVGASGDVSDLGAVDWADFDHNGDILYSEGGRLFRLQRRIAEPMLVADLNDRRFEPVVAPDWALVWPRSMQTRPI
jgi:hypothetical protein